MIKGNKRQWNASCTMVLLGDLVMCGLVVLECGHLFGFRGCWRMLSHGVPTGLLISGVSYVMMKWYQVVNGRRMFDMNGSGGGSEEDDQGKRKKLLLLFCGFNVCFHVLFWPPWIASGLFETKAVWLSNILVGISMIWLGVCGLIVSFGIGYLGRRLMLTLEETNQLTQSKQIKNIIKKVLVLLLLLFLLFVFVDIIIIPHRSTVILGPKVLSGFQWEEEALLLESVEWLNHQLE
jgi:hypothetical protein